MALLPRSSGVRNFGPGLSQARIWDDDVLARSRRLIRACVVVLESEFRI